jgi:7SK snRNA methylphosphate capping enzyme
VKGKKHGVAMNPGDNPYLAHWREPVNQSRRKLHVNREGSGSRAPATAPPVVAQAWQGRGQGAGDRRQVPPGKAEPAVEAHPSNTIFLHGNYHNYYGYRHAPGELGTLASGSPEDQVHAHMDARLMLLDPAWMRGKRVLDLGCNQGNVTIDAARFFHPAWIQGIDLDPHLIRQAHLQQSRIWSQHHPRVPVDTLHPGMASAEVPDITAYFPASCAVMFGLMPVETAVNEVPSAISSSPVPMDEGDEGERKSIANSPTFPSNLTFRVGNWVHEPLLLPEERVHVILALSVTKWIHLNEGDAGLKYFFTKCYQSLLPGGVLILEPQDLAGYRKRTHLSPVHAQNFAEIKLFPAMFVDYLKSKQVGFSRVTCLQRASPGAKGFARRPVYALWK